MIIIRDLIIRSKRAAEKFADKVSEWFGTPLFLFLNIGFWLIWISIGIEPFPFGELTMLLSMQAIIMSILILAAANRQQRKEKELAEHDRQRDMAVHEQVEDIHDDVEAIKHMLDEIVDDE